MFSVEDKQTGEWLGVIGLVQRPDTLPFAPCTEIGWRMKKSTWGKGLATEGAREVLRYGFEELGLEGDGVVHCRGE